MKAALNGGDILVSGGSLWLHNLIILIWLPDQFPLPSTAQWWILAPRQKHEKNICPFQQTVHTWMDYLAMPEFDSDRPISEWFRAHQA